ncbi:uncharacterized protein [Paramisgurnus dabryanus]|uniref:uncharacterized protein n=1 Tax=Paramisgurnus dabryanus TaxID=90735 RepID=UPI0031F369DB
MPPLQAILKNLDKFLKNFPVFSSFPFALLLIGLEELIELNFSCPCKYELNKYLTAFIFTGPPLFAFTLMFIALRPCNYGWRFLNKAGDDQQSFAKGNKAGDDQQSSSKASKGGDDQLRHASANKAGDDQQTSAKGNKAVDDQKSFAKGNKAGQDQEISAKGHKAGGDQQSSSKASKAGDDQQTSAKANKAGDDQQSFAEVNEKKDDHQNCWKALGHCLIPPVMWIITALIDGDYVACGLTNWKGTFVFDPELRRAWCKPSESANGGNQSELRYEYQGYISISTTLGYAMLAVFSVVTVFLMSMYDCFTSGKCDCFKSENSACGGGTQRVQQDVEQGYGQEFTQL